MSTAYLAADGYERQLDGELARRGCTAVARHGRLVITAEPPQPVAWAVNTWYEPERITITSIAHAARELRARQRNWWPYAPTHTGRAKLIVSRLPYVSAKPQPAGELAPRAPLGSFTLLDATTLLVAARCSSAFPNGEVTFAARPDGPPSRAYLKLWEAFLYMDRWPQPGERALDLGASPGGWTWALAQLGSTVTAIDRSPLDPPVAALAGVTFASGDAFAAEPSDWAPLDWLCCDVAAYPQRTLELAQRWVDAGAARHAVITVKFQGATDHDTAEQFAAIDGGRLVHLHHNKHELTFLWSR